LLEMQDEWSHRGYNDMTALTNRASLGTHINSQSYCGGLYDNGSGQIQPLKYLIGLALASREAGAHIFEYSRVVKIDRGAKKTLHFHDAPPLTAERVVLCGNAYLTDIGLRDMSRRLARVTSSVLATTPLSDNMIQHILPSRATVADSRQATALAAGVRRTAGLAGRYTSTFGGHPVDLVNGYRTTGLASGGGGPGSDPQAEAMEAPAALVGPLAADSGPANGARSDRRRLAARAGDR